MERTEKQNVTISLDNRVILKAKILAAKRATSISGMLAEQVEALVLQDEGREQAIASSLARLTRGLHMGGSTLAGRDSLHER